MVNEFDCNFYSALFDSARFDNSYFDLLNPPIKGSFKVELTEPDMSVSLTDPDKTAKFIKGENSGNDIVQ